MPDRRRKTDWPIIAGVILALVAVVMSGYVGGYFGLQIDTWDGRGYRGGLWVVRFYDTEWQAATFRPAAWIETHLTGINVGTVTPSNPIPDNLIP